MTKAKTYKYKGPNKNPKAGQIRLSFLTSFFWQCFSKCFYFKYDFVNHQDKITPSKKEKVLKETLTQSEQMRLQDWWNNGNKVKGRKKRGVRTALHCLNALEVRFRDCRSPSHPLSPSRPSGQKPGRVTACRSICHLQNPLAMQRSL